MGHGESTSRDGLPCPERVISELNITKCAKEASKLDDMDRNDGEWQQYVQIDVRL